MSITRRQALAAAVAAPLAAVAGPALAKPGKTKHLESLWTPCESGRLKGIALKPEEYPDDWYPYNPHRMPIIDEDAWGHTLCTKHQLAMGYAAELAYWRHRADGQVKEAGRERRMSAHCRLIDEKNRELRHYLERSKVFRHLLFEAPQLHYASGGISMHANASIADHRAHYKLFQLGYNFTSEFDQRYKGGWNPQKPAIAVTLFEVYAHRVDTQCHGGSFIVSDPWQLCLAHSELDKIFNDTAYDQVVHVCMQQARIALQSLPLDAVWPEDIWAIAEKQWNAELDKYGRKGLSSRTARS